MTKREYVRHKFPTLEQMHQDFEINCLPPDLSRVQSVEMKKAFMVGVASMFHALKYDIDENTDGDIGCRYLESIDTQLSEFFTKTIHEL